MTVDHVASKQDLSLEERHLSMTVDHVASKQAGVD